MAQQQIVHQIARGVDLGGQLHLGKIAHVPLEDLRQQIDHRRIDRPELESLSCHPFVPDEFFLHLLQQILDLHGVAHQHAPFHGQRHLTAVAVEEPDPQLPLQFADAAAHRGLGDVQLARRQREPADARHRQEVAQMVQIHPVPFVEPTPPFLSPPLRLSASPLCFQFRRSLNSCSYSCRILP